MKFATPLLAYLLLLAPAALRSQNAPVTTAGSVLEHGTDVTVPVTVTSFTDIGTFTLTLDYDNAIVQVAGVTPNASLAGFNSDWTTTPGRIVMTWTGSSGVTLSDYSHLADISFTGLASGYTDLTWFDDGTSCQYLKYDGGLNTLLNDAPFSTYYHNGKITWQRPGPVTTLPVLYAAPGQTLCVPVTVNQFTDVGSISLMLNYDPAVLAFTGFNATGIPGNWYFDAQAAVPGTLAAGGYGPGFSLADGSKLFEACFTFNGGTSALAWNDIPGTSCEYADAAGLYPLYDTPAATYYINGSVSDVLTADFSADNTTPQKNATVHFTDLTTADPTSWQWTFDRASDVIYVGGTSATSQNPQVQFTDGGPYTVTLTAHNATQTDTEVKTAYIWVGIPGLWDGSASDDWNTADNWDDHRVPASQTSVVIPNSAPNWPIYPASLTLGTTCRNITMQGMAQLMVEGNLAINPGSVLEFTGSGTVQVSLNWTNNGIFRCGTGTVEFISPLQSQITGGLNPSNNVANFYRETFSAALSPISGGTSGPTSEDSHTDVNLGFTFNYLGVDYTQARINSNGWLSLNLTGDDPGSDNSALFTTTAPSTTIAPWWDNLKMAGFSTVTYKTTGTAPNRVFTAEWKDMVSYKSAANARLTFQVLLYETTHVIEFVYGPVISGSHSPSEGASIGLEDATGGTGHYLEATTGSTTTPVTNLSSANAWPEQNFRFTPPPGLNTFWNLTISKASNKLVNPTDIVVNANLTVN